MDYTVRQLIRNSKEVFDKASSVPVRIRRGSEFFELIKLKMIDARDAEQPKGNAPKGNTDYMGREIEYYPEDFQPNGYQPNGYQPSGYKPNGYGKKTMDDLFREGGIQKGIG